MPRLLILIMSLLAILAVPVGALAQDGVSSPAASTPVPSPFKIAPEAGDDPAVTAQGYFVYELAAGDEATGSVRLSNPGAEPVTVELAAVDAETAQTGGSAFADAEATASAAATWVRLDEPRVTIAPGQQSSVGFSVNPPAGTAPGQYLAGLTAYVPATPKEMTATGADQAGASVTMQTRYVIGVQVDVPGEWTPSMTITGASALEQPSGTKLGIAMRNDGDEFIKPKGSVTLTDATGSEILTQPIELGTFLTGTDVTYPVSWPGVPVGGEYGVDVELNYADDKVARYRGMLTVSDNAPVAQPAPGEETQPAVAPVPAPAPAPFPIPMWVLYAIGGLLALIAVLLILVLVRLTRGGRSNSEW